MQVDVCQERTDDSALRCSYGCIAHRTLLHDSRSKKHPDQFQEFLIPDTALQESQHELVVHIIEERRNISFDDPPITRMWS